MLFIQYNNQHYSIYCASKATVNSHRPQGHCCGSLQCWDTPHESFPSSPQRSLSEQGWECPAGKSQTIKVCSVHWSTHSIIWVQLLNNIDNHSTVGVPLSWPWCCWGWLLSGCCRCCGFSPGSPPRWWGWVAHRERSWMGLLSLHLEAQTYVLRSHTVVDIWYDWNVWLKREINKK